MDPLKGTIFTTASSVTCNRANVTRHRLACGGSPVNEIKKRTTTMRQSCTSDRPESEQRAYFHAALERAIAAESKAGTVERFFSLAGSVLNLKFAGDSLAGAFTPALAHLEIAPTAYPDAVFHIWDSESTGMEMVPPPTSRGCFTKSGRHLDDGKRSRTRAPIHGVSMR